MVCCVCVVGHLRVVGVQWYVLAIVEVLRCVEWVLQVFLDDVHVAGM